MRGIHSLVNNFPFYKVVNSMIFHYKTIVLTILNIFSFYKVYLFGIWIYLPKSISLSYWNSPVQRTYYCIPLSVCLFICFPDRPSVCLKSTCRARTKKRFNQCFQKFSLNFGSLFKAIFENSNSIFIDFLFQIFRFRDMGFYT